MFLMNIRRWLSSKSTVSPDKLSEELTNIETQRFVRQGIRACSPLHASLLEGDGWKPSSFAIWNSNFLLRNTKGTRTNRKDRQGHRRSSTEWMVYGIHE
ncbi:hypothetical protein CDAR_519661 [Caerostris darwini]|uniref:Uncharacterized protein n=1 Tax=Caerostris darwini TaxID=1538125 RepID=A0AAV4RAH2_9ARAC|nr:hypothetical protein CDAR_519661 [Caerostris darwini]